MPILPTVSPFPDSSHVPIPEVKDIVLDGQGVQEVKILEDKAKITQTEICQLAFLDFGDVLIV